MESDVEKGTEVPKNDAGEDAGVEKSRGKENKLAEVGNCFVKFKNTFFFDKGCNHNGYNLKSKEKKCEKELNLESKDEIEKNSEKMGLAPKNKT